MTKNIYYPAIFHIAEEGGYWISFPDFEECFSQGESIDEAFSVARQSMELAIEDRLDNGMELPTPTTFNKVKCKKGEIVGIIDFDMLAYKKAHNSKAIKKTLSIPEWLNEEATSRNINFSKVLQDALITKIGG